MRTLEEIAGRILFLDQVKEELLLKRKLKKIPILTRAIQELCWTLGVDVK